MNGEIRDRVIEARRRVDEIRDKVAGQRTELRMLYDEIRDLLGSVDCGVENLDAAIDALTELLPNPHDQD